MPIGAGPVVAFVRGAPPRGKGASPAASTWNESPSTVTRRWCGRTSGSSITTSLEGSDPTVSVVASPKSRRATVARYDVGEERSHSSVSCRSCSIARVTESAAARSSRTGVATVASRATANGARLGVHRLQEFLVRLRLGELVHAELHRLDGREVVEELPQDPDLPQLLALQEQFLLERAGLA